MPFRFLACGSILLSLLSAGCSTNSQGEMTPTSPSLVMTSTLPAAPPISPSETPLSTSPQPTIVPVDGATSTQINVRAEPSTSGIVLGIIPANTRIEIIGKDPGGSWWQIIYPHPDAVDGKGWVTAQFITVPGTPEVPVIGGAATGTASGNVAIVQEQINVRSGPGTDFNSLGTLNPQDVVSLTGKDPDGSWLQIDFASGPEGKGWINAAFVQAQGAENLPIVADSGQVVGTGTPTNVPPTPTPTVVPAREDNDSAGQPLVSVTFDPIATRTFIYRGDVSAPVGDPEDWVQFTAFNERIRVEVSCTGNTPNVELIQNGQVLEQIACGTQPVISVVPDVPAQIHIRAQSESALRYSSYSVKVSTIP